MAFSGLRLALENREDTILLAFHSGETAHRGTGGHEEVGEMAAGDLGASA